MKRAVLAVTVLTVLSIAGVAQALDFSADMVSTARGQRMSGKIFVADDKIRMDMAGNVTITRMDKQVVWILMPQQLLYMEQAFDPEMVAGATEKMPGEIERSALGPGTVDGRAATKYRITYASREGRATVIQWVDKASSIPVKTEAEDGSWAMEYRNLKTGPQDAPLFEIPAGYTKFTVPNMADIMRAAGQQTQGGD